MKRTSKPKQSQGDDESTLPIEPQDSGVKNTELLQAFTEDVEPFREPELSDDEASSNLADALANDSANEEENASSDNEVYSISQDIRLGINSNESAEIIAGKCESEAEACDHSSVPGTPENSPSANRSLAHPNSSSPPVTATVKTKTRPIPTPSEASDNDDTVHDTHGPLQLHYTLTQAPTQLEHSAPSKADRSKPNARNPSSSVEDSEQMASRFNYEAPAVTVDMQPVVVAVSVNRAHSVKQSTQTTIVTDPSKSTRTEAESDAKPTNSRESEAAVEEEDPEENSQAVFQRFAQRVHKLTRKDQKAFKNFARSRKQISASDEGRTKVEDEEEAEEEETDKPKKIAPRSSNKSKARTTSAARKNTSRTRAAEHADDGIVYDSAEDDTTTGWVKVAKPPEAKKAKPGTLFVGTLKEQERLKVPTEHSAVDGDGKTSKPAASGAKTPLKRRYTKPPASTDDIASGEHTETNDSEKENIKRKSQSTGKSAVDSAIRTTSDAKPTTTQRPRAARARQHEEDPNYHTDEIDYESIWKKNSLTRLRQRSSHQSPGGHREADMLPSTQDIEGPSDSDGAYSSSSPASSVDSQTPRAPSRRCSNLFVGIRFLLTGLKRGVRDEDIAQDSDQSDNDGLADVSRGGRLYDRIADIIRANGGTVFNPFSEAYTGMSLTERIPSRGKAANIATVLVADKAHRTHKYILALAAGIPCVKYTWVVDSVSEGKLQPMVEYLLPAGHSLETGEDVPQRDDVVAFVSETDANKMSKKKSRVAEGNDMFEGARIEIVGPKEFRDAWTMMLKEAGARVVKRLFGEHEQRIEYVLSGAEPSRQVVSRVEQLGIPLVTVEWAIQCLLAREILKPDANVLYTHDF